MIQYLQAEEVVEEAANMTTNLVKGDTSGLNEVIRQCVTWGIDAGKSILLAIAIFIVGRFLISLINRVLASMLERRKVDQGVQSFLKSFVNILLTILLILTVVSALGVNTTSFAALLASAGVAVGMALSGNLQNLAGGIIILLFKPYRVGDLVEAQGVIGVVNEIQIFHTILLTADNKVIFVPNGSLSSGNIVNYSKQDSRRVDLTIGVEYGQDIDKVRQTLLDIFAADTRIKQDPAPFIVVGELASSSVDIVIRVWVDAADYWSVYFGLNETIYNEFNKRGIGFPFPQIQVHNS